ncbi:MAG: hypothetical protein ACRDOO_08700 [Actinomadura sp.]
MRQQMLKRNRFGYVGVIYVIVGVVVALTHDYITSGLLTRIASALLAIFLWPLPLLGIDLNLN